MKVGQWKCFWGWFLLVSILAYIAGTILIYLKPKIYESTVVFELLELYPGEDPEPPAAAADPREAHPTSIRQLGESSLYELKTYDVDPSQAALRANEMVVEYSELRQQAAIERVKAAQAATDPDSPEWRQLEIERISPKKAVDLHVRAIPAMRPNLPDVDKSVAKALVIAIGIGLALAALITRLSSKRLQAGADLPWVRIRRRFTKLATIIGAVFLLLSAILFELQPLGFTSTAIIEFPPESHPSFENHLQILSSGGPIIDAVEQADLARQYALTPSELVSHIRPNLEVAGDRDKLRAEIRYTDSESHLVDFIPKMTASAFISRNKSLSREKLLMLAAELEFALNKVDPDSALASDLQEKIDTVRQQEKNLEMPELVEITPAEQQPRDWLGWLGGESWKEILRGCFWAILITFLTLILMSGSKKRVETPSWERDAAVRDPY